jgi:hypothetical protein
MDSIPQRLDWKSAVRHVQNIHPTVLEASNGYDRTTTAPRQAVPRDPRTLPTVYNVTVLGNKEYMGGASWAPSVADWRQVLQPHLQNFPLGLEIRDVETKSK